jgi:hypothetical protein
MIEELSNTHYTIRTSKKQTTRLKRSMVLVKTLEKRYIDCIKKESMLTKKLRFVFMDLLLIFSENGT